MRPITLVGISSYALIRNGFQPIVSKSTSLTELLATFADFPSAHPLLHSTRCDVVITDDSHPRSVSLLGAIKTIHHIAPTTAIVLVLQQPMLSLFSAFLNHGVKAILHRSDPLEVELPQTIVLVRQGGMYFSQTISRLREPQTTRPLALSQRENDILRLMVQGYNAKEISAQIDLSSKSIYRYLHDLRQRFGAINNEQLVSVVQQLGFLSFEDNA
jgi:two-component system capsular synthesis response regulator RcsB